MLTLEESRWPLGVFKMCSILNIFPIKINVKSGKIQKQSNTVQVLIWKILFGIGISHSIFDSARLVQSTIIEPQKYFRWDHFVLHFACTFAAAVFYFTAFSLFVTNAEEFVMIFNQLFEEREDPVQKMMDKILQMPSLFKSAHEHGKLGNKIRPKSGVKTEPNEEGQNEDEVTENQSRSGFRSKSRPLLAFPPQYSLDELVAKLVAFSAVFSSFFIISFLALDPTRPQLLYSALPSEYQNPRSFIILLAVETLWILVFMLTSGFALVVQVLFFGKCQLEFKRLSLQIRNLQEKFQNGTLGVRHIKTEIWILRQILDEMKELVVLIELFNRCFPFCIFAWKVCCLSMSIMSYFFVIRHFGDFPILGLFIGYMANVLTLTYTIMYGHAFAIPGKMDELKNEFLFTAQKTTEASTAGSNARWNKMLWKELKREIKKIRGVGIKVGNFNKLERESTPNFIDFVLKNVVTLLVTIRR